MKVSVITCTWNSAATLEDTLSSVQKQTYPNIEHVFVDGGSTDGTLELIARYKPEATVLKGVRGGISRAMNEGVRAATGDVISHLHSDDFFADADVVQAAVDSLQLHPGAQWMFGQVTVLKDGQLHPPPTTPRRYSYGRYVRGAASIAHPAVFIRRPLFLALGGFDEGLKYAMDIDLWLRLGRKHQPLQMAKVVSVFREHEGSLSTSNVLAARREEFQVRLRHGRARPLDLSVYMLRYARRMQRLKARLANGAAPA